MGKQFFLLILLVFHTGFSASAFEVVLAPLKVYSFENEKYSGSQVSSMIADDNRYIVTSESVSSAVANLMEASSLCDREGLDNLIFGYITGDEVKISMELKFYNHRTRTVETSFFASDGVGQVERLVENISEKILSYIETDLGYFEQEPEKVLKPGVFSIPAVLGYWIPLDSGRRGCSQSVFSAGSGLVADPFPDLYESERISLELRFGLSVLYEMSINDPDFETFYLHTIHFFLPVQLGLTVAEKHSFSVFAAPLIQMDILDIRKNFEDKAIGGSAAAGFSVGIAYDCIFTDFFRCGLSCSFDFVFYDPLQVTIRPEVRALFTPGSFVEEDVR